MEDKRISISQLMIQIREYPNEGQAIVFLHFGGANLEMWQGVVPYFAEEYHLVLIDLRGHGKSDKPARGYHIDEMAGDVVGVMEVLGIASAHILGSSLGAEVGLSLAANHPDRVRSLVCDGALHSEYGPYGLWEGTEDQFQEYTDERLRKIQSRSEEVYSSANALVENSRDIFSPHGMWNEIFESVIRYDAIELPDGGFISSWGRIAEDYTRHFLFYCFEGYYSRVSCPVLMLPDTEMKKGSRAEQAMRGLLSLTPRGKIAAVPGWMHPFGWMLTPEVVSVAVLDFFREISQSSIS